MDKKEQLIEVFKGQDLFKVYDLNNINHRPHPYMIGPEHITWSHDGNFGGMISEECIRNGEEKGKVRCYHPKCQLLYDDHIFDAVCFLQLLRNGTDDEAAIIMKDIVNKLGKDFIDGFSFIESEEKWRIEDE